MNDNSLEDVLAAIRNQVNQKKEVSDEVENDHDKLVEENPVVGSLTKEINPTLHKIRSSIEKLQEINKERESVEIRRTETFSVSEESLDSAMKLLINKWILSNEDKMINQLQDSVQSEVFSKKLLQEALSNILTNNSSYKDYMQQVLLQYVKSNESYIKQSIEKTIQVSIKDNLYQIIEDVIQKIMREK